MRKNFTAVVLLALAVLYGIDGGFDGPSPLKIAQGAVIAAGLVLQILVWRKERKKK